METYSKNVCLWFLFIFSLKKYLRKIKKIRQSTLSLLSTLSLSNDFDWIERLFNVCEGTWLASLIDGSIDYQNSTLNSRQT